MIAISFFVLAAYVLVESVRMLLGGDHPIIWIPSTTFAFGTQ